MNFMIYIAVALWCQNNPGSETKCRSQMLECIARDGMTKKQYAKYWDDIMKNHGGMIMTSVNTEPPKSCFKRWM